MKRIEGQSSPLAYAQLALAALIIIEFIFPLYFLQAAAFRPGRSPETLQAYSDVGWLLFVGVVCTAVLQFLLLAVAILVDDRAEPIFPRWFGYFTAWCAIAFAPGSLCVFTQDGPFAWRGLFCWWIPLTAFGVWFIVATPLLLKIIAKQERDETAASADEAGTAGAVDLDARRQVELLTAEMSALRAELTAQRAGTAGSAAD